jgi:hypothetical protein
VDAAKLAQFMRKRGGAVLAFAAALVLTRNIGLALMAGALAYSFLQGKGWFLGGGERPASANISAVRTAYLELSLDRGTGAMSGRVLKGRFAGRTLAGLNATERLDFLAELRANDAQGAQLYEVYLDRAGPGPDGSGTGPQERSPSRAMGVEEAYLVLGLSPGASRSDIQAAHRNLMKRFHPDQGGTTYIAAKVNEAKDVLLKHVKA